MVLSDKTILKRMPELVWLPLSDKDVSVEGLFSQINPNSLDLTISEEYMRPIKKQTFVDYGFKSAEDQKRYADEYWMKDYPSEDNYITLYPGEVILSCTREFITMPKDLCGQLFTKSTLGRMFINHMMAGVVDAGFEGRLTLELKNDCFHKVRIPIGARIVQLIFYQLDYVPDNAYGERHSRYMNAKTVECAKWAS